MVRVGRALFGTDRGPRAPVSWEVATPGGPDGPRRRVRPRPRGHALRCRRGGRNGSFVHEEVDGLPGLVDDDYDDYDEYDSGRPRSRGQRAAVDDDGRAPRPPRRARDPDVTGDEANGTAPAAAAPDRPGLPVPRRRSGPSPDAAGARVHIVAPARFADAARSPTG